MKIIKDPRVLIGMLESGEFVDKLQAKLTETQMKLTETAGPKGKASGHVTIKLNMKMEAGRLTITPDLTNKQPPDEFASSTFWVTEDGELSTQHPRQTDMFAGPREVGERSTN